MTRTHLLRRSAPAALALLLALAAPAAAHTRLESSSPAAGSTVPAGVREIRIRFTQRVEARFTSLGVLHDGAALLLTDSVRPVPGSGGREFVLAVPDGLPAGAYDVTWRTAGADGHVITGRFAFRVAPSSADTVAPAVAHDQTRVAPPGVSAAPRETSLLPVAVRWAGYLALLGMIGAVGFTLAVADRLRRAGTHAAAADRAAYGAWLLALAAAALSVGALAGRLWVQSAALNGARALEGERLEALLTGTTWGSAWVLQAVATLAFVVGLFVARAPHGRGVGWMGAAVGAFLLAWVPALSGHAAAAERLTALSIVADTVHVLGAGVWLGTLAVLLAAGLPAALAGPDGGQPALAAMVNAFSPVALAGAGALGATGVVNSLFHLSEPAELLGTAYGRALLLKLALLGVVAAIGLFNWRFVRPRLDAPAAAARLRRTAATELAFGALVVLVTAVLVALPTP